MNFGQSETAKTINRESPLTNQETRKASSCNERAEVEKKKKKKSDLKPQFQVLLSFPKKEGRNHCSYC